jgi:hypothetical protein
MRTKVTFLVGFATGYVLGSRAGRARYEQIRQAARSFLDSPAVASTTAALQQQAGDALTTAKDRATERLGEKITDRLGDRTPSWLSPHGEQTGAGSRTSHNGHSAPTA